MTDRIYYFAYGSNMSIRRLAERIQDIKAIGPAHIDGFDLRFHKKGSDGSGKCDAFHTGQATDRLYGRCFLIRPEDRAVLDRFEGLGNGYDHRLVMMEVAGRPVEALTYVATHIEDGLHPWSWYHHHVLTGARETGLHPDWIARIRQVKHQPDPDRERHQAEMQIYRQAE